MERKNAFLKKIEKNMKKSWMLNLRRQDQGACKSIINCKKTTQQKLKENFFHQGELYFTCCINFLRLS